MDGVVESTQHFTDYSCRYFSDLSKLVLTIWIAVTVASTRLVGRGYGGALMYVPAILGALLVNLLPGHNKVGLLFSYWVSGAGEAIILTRSCPHAR